MAHGIAAIASTTATSLATAVQDWGQFAAAISAIVAASAGLRGQLLRRRRRRHARSTAPKPPPLGATKRQIEIYAAQLEQHLKDQKGDDG